MKVLYLCTSGQIGGGNRSLLALWDELRQKDMEVIVLCPWEGPMVEACRERGISCHVMNYNWLTWRKPFDILVNYYRWDHFLNKVRPDLVHANDLSAARAVTLPAKRFGIPIVCHVRFPLQAEYTTWCLRGLPKPKVFIFISYALHNQVKTEFLSAFPQSMHQIIHNGVNLNEFKNSEERAIRDSFRIAIIANLLPVKGYPVFLKMANELMMSGLRIEFWIVGDDIHNTGYQKELESMVEEMNLTTVVHFLGFRHDIPQILEQIDILVSTALEEPFGRTIVEAMGSCLPVVATSVGGVPEIIEDDKTGILVSSGDVAALVTAVKGLLTDPKRRLVMGKAGRKRVEEYFSIQSHAKAVMKVYDSLLCH